MAQAKKKTERFKLSARIHNKRKSPGDFSARLALVDRIADLPGIEAVESNDETTPRRVDIFLRREGSDRALKRRAAKRLCSLDCGGVYLNGLDRWERNHVLAKGWGKLVDHEVYVHLPRDSKELEIVWKVVQRAYDRLMGPGFPEAGSLLVSTWDWPGFSRTSLQ